MRDKISETGTDPERSVNRRVPTCTDVYRRVPLKNDVSKGDHLDGGSYEVANFGLTLDSHGCPSIGCDRQISEHVHILNSTTGLEPIRMPGKG